MSTLRNQIGNRTPLSYAALDGGDRVVNVLLGRKEVNPCGVDGSVEHRTRGLLCFDMREW